MRVPAWVLGILCCGGAVTALAQEPEVRSVEPGRRGDLLTAAIRAVHLPGARIESSLGTGLPSAIEMHLVLRDDRNRRIGENRVFLRVAYDLWDEVFHLEGAGTDERFVDLASLRSFLTRLPQLPVAPLSVLDETRRHRIRVDCRLHPIAPRETRRLESWVTGTAGTDRGADNREVSVGLNDLIRFFYKGAQRNDDVTAERFSPWFLAADLDTVPPAGDGGASQ